MTEASFRDLIPDLAELDSKAGRKTPESLLSWMKDAAGGGDQALVCDADDRGDRGSALGDSVSAKINYLKEEMRRLRRADVRILWQLASVHEGIETMRWLMEDRPWSYPYRESWSPTCPQDLTEATEKEPERLQLPLSDDGEYSHYSYATAVNHKDEAELPGSSVSICATSWCKQGNQAQAPAHTASELPGTSLQESQTEDLEASSIKSIKTSASTIKKVLLRASRVRKGVTAHTSGSIFTTQSEEPRAALDDTPASVQEAQWDWMESQDEVTFL